MKRCIKILIGIAILSVASVGTVNAAGLEGTKHDLTSNATKTGDQSLCTYCHAAHSSLPQVPLWGRTGTASVFSLYASPTMNATMGQPGGISRGCLSCHDGVTAFDALLGSTGAASGNNMNTNYPGSPAIISLDMSDDHPVGVDITADSVGIESESTITSGGLKIYSSKVECASCHDAHGTDGYAYFLRLDPDGGALCETCHTK